MYESRDMYQLCIICLFRNLETSSRAGCPCLALMGLTLHTRRWEMVTRSGCGSVVLMLRHHLKKSSIASLGKGKTGFNFQKSLSQHFHFRQHPSPRHIKQQISVYSPIYLFEYNCRTLQRGDAFRKWLSIPCRSKTLYHALNNLNTKMSVKNLPYQATVLRSDPLCKGDS